MKICYLLESTDLHGGVKVVFDQSRALTKRGHTVFVRALTGNHSWYPYHVNINYVKDLALPFEAGEYKPDVVVATFWTTARAAIRLNCSKTFHLCQGFEGLLSEYSHIKKEIEDIYRIPIPKITIGRWLSDLLIDQFGEDVFKTHCVGQIVDLELFKPLPFWKKRISEILPNKFNVLIVGSFEVSVKAIPDALKAVDLLRRRGKKICLVRVSTGEMSPEEESITCIDEYHHNAYPEKLVRIYQNSDLFIAPSLSHEGFGLPFAEALACGVPAVATSIPSHLSFDETHDYACFVPENNPHAIAEAAQKIMESARLQKKLIKKGPGVVNKRFRGSLVAERLESVFINE